MSTNGNNTKLYTSLRNDVNHFVYKDPVQNKHKALTVYINESKESMRRPRYQLASHVEPRLRAPFGISDGLDESKKDDGRKTLDMSIETDELLENLSILDEHNIRIAAANCKKWFKRDLSEDQIRFMYRPIVKPDNSGKGYRPMFRTKINVKNRGNMNAKIFEIREKDGKQIEYIPRDASFVKRGARVVPIVEVGSLWFTTHQFGMTLECTDLIVFPQQESPEFSFQWGESIVVRKDPDVMDDTPDPPLQSSDPSLSEKGGDYIPPSYPHEDEFEN